MTISADVTVLGGLTLHVELFIEDDYHDTRSYGIDGIYWPPKGRKGKYRAVSQAVYDRVVAYDEGCTRNGIVDQVLSAHREGW